MFTFFLFYVGHDSKFSCLFSFHLSRKLNCEVEIIYLIPLIFFAVIDSRLIFDALKEVCALLKDLPVASLKEGMALANDSVKDSIIFAVKTCSPASFIEEVFAWEWFSRNLIIKILTRANKL